LWAVSKVLNDVKYPKYLPDPMREGGKPLVISSVQVAQRAWRGRRKATGAFASAQDLHRHVSHLHVEPCCLTMVIYAKERPAHCKSRPRRSRLSHGSSQGCPEEQQKLPRAGAMRGLHEKVIVKYWMNASSGQGGFTQKRWVRHCKQQGGTQTSAASTQPWLQTVPCLGAKFVHNSLMKSPDRCRPVGF
jgi:hypothetical protein